MNKSCKKQYELDRTYDYGKEGSSKKRKFVKCRAHKRLRHDNKHTVKVIMVKPVENDCCTPTQFATQCEQPKINAGVQETEFNKIKVATEWDGCWFCDGCGAMKGYKESGYTQIGNTNCYCFNCKEKLVNGEPLPKRPKGNY